MLTLTASFSYTAMAWLGAETGRASAPQVFDIPVESCLRTSAKTGFGLEDVLPAVIERIPPPRCFKWPSMRALVRVYVSHASHATAKCPRVSSITCSGTVLACEDPHH